MTRTFVDTGVLITAWRGKEPEASRALRLLDDPDRSFASSIFVKLEALPLPKFNRHQDEVEFLEGFFNAVQSWAASPAEVIEMAISEAEKAGLTALDALHVAAALATECEELVTTEKGTKRLARATSVRVRSI